MISEQLLTTLLNHKGNYSFEVIKLAPVAPPVNRCVYAELYTQWATEAGRDITKYTSIRRLYEVLLVGTLKYFELKSQVPQEHLELAKQDSHVCLYEAFEQLFQWLETLAILQPEYAQSLLPQPPPPVSTPLEQAPQFQGIYLGRDLGRAFE